MSEKPPYTQAQLMEKVRAVIAALAADGATVPAAASLDALAFVAAMIYDLDPTVSAPSHLRKAAELQGGTVLTYLKFLRRHYETSGVHFAEAIGGTVELDPEMLAEMTKGATKQ
jgi:hypothetical protein